MSASYSSSGPGLDGIMKGIAALQGADVLVGIPEGDDRKQSLLDRAASMKLTRSGGLTKNAKKLMKAAAEPISNAELLFIFTNGSPLRNQPPRVVIEAAIEAEPTKSLIAKYMAEAATCALDGDEEGMMAALDKAGTLGESASKAWFTNPENGWAPNAAATVRAKGSATPGVDTAQMRRAITHVVEIGAAAHEGNAADHGRFREAESSVEELAETTVDAIGEVGEVGEVAEVAGEALL